MDTGFWRFFPWLAVGQMPCERGSNAVSAWVKCRAAVGRMPLPV